MQIGDRVFVTAENYGIGGVLTGLRGGLLPYRVRTDDQQETWYAQYEVERCAEPYDSRPDTALHIGRVRALLSDVERNLAARGKAHDASKLQSPEREMFDRYTPLLRSLTYGSPEYEAVRREMLETALAHHYAHNSHHPEHYPNGISGMSLLDVIEMLCDWKAATERHADGSIAKSLEINRSRFGAVDLHQVFENTAREMGWIE